jgi:hypothetical protein
VVRGTVVTGPIVPGGPEPGFVVVVVDDPEDLAGEVVVDDPDEDAPALVGDVCGGVVSL